MRPVAKPGPIVPGSLRLNLIIIRPRTRFVQPFGVLFASPGTAAAIDWPVATGDFHERKGALTKTKERRPGAGKVRHPAGVLSVCLATLRRAAIGHPITAPVPIA